MVAFCCPRKVTRLKTQKTGPEVVIAEKLLDTYGRKTCESCGHLIKEGQRIRRWYDGILTHELCVK